MFLGEKIKKELQLLGVIGILTIFSLIVFPGYKVFISDHELYIPAIYQSLNPGLFQNDLLLSFNQAAYTLFDELIIFLINALNINIFYALFFLTIIVRFIYFYSIYKIAFYFTNNQQFSIFSILLFIAGFSVYGTVSSTLDIILVPRLMGLSLNLLFLALFFNKKWVLSTLPLGIGILIHPITSIPFIIFFFLAVFFFSDKKRFFDKSSLLLGVIPLVFLIFLVLTIKSSGLGLFTFIDPLWESIIRFRDPYIFITSWHYSDFLFLLASICMLIISYLELREIFENITKKKYFYLLILIPLLLFALSFITVDILKMHFFAQLQMSRSLFLWKIFITLFFSYFAYEYIKTNPKDILYNFPLVGLILSFILKEPFIFLFLPMFFFLWMKRKYNLFGLTKIRIFKKDQFSVVIFSICTIGLSTIFLIKISYLVAIILLSILATLMVTWKSKLVFGHKSTYLFLILLVISTIILIPKFSVYPLYFEDKSLIEACDWVKNNTDEEDVFITEPFSKASGPLRLTCYRNVFTCFKDGAQVIFKRDYAFEWKKRIDLVSKLEKNPNLLSEISKEYNVNYIFSDHRLNLSYSLVFNNTKYFIYKLDVGDISR